MADYRIDCVTTGREIISTRAKAIPDGAADWTIKTDQCT
jgi:hypothetical protein